jgi:hypothetical protein
MVRSGVRGGEAFAGMAAGAVEGRLIGLTIVRSQSSLDEATRTPERGVLTIV